MAVPPMLSKKVITNNLKSLCTSYEDLGLTKFFRSDVKDFLSRLRETEGLIFLIEPVRIKAGYVNRDYIQEKYFCGFTVADQIVTGEFENNDDVIDACLLHAKQFMKRIENLCIGKSIFSDAVFHNLDIESIVYNETPILPDGRQGITCIFAVYHQDVTTIDITKWTDL